MTIAAPFTRSQGASRFDDTLVTRTIRAIEDSGPLEDASELRDAARQAATHEDQVIARARALGRRIGLLEDLERIGNAARIVVPLVAIAVVLLTWVLVRTVLGEGRQINVVMAWIAVLGPSFISLLVWTAAVLAPSTGSGTLAEGLGGIALWASSRPKWAGSHAPALFREGIELVREARLLPWAFGVVNHGIWALSFMALTGVLYVMFAVRSYQLTWESTILSQSTFAGFIATTGRPAEMLGLPRGDVQIVTLGHASASAQLAFWLMYCVLLYGLVPRLLLALLSWWKWTRSKEQLRVDFTDPYYRRLFQRLDQLKESVIVDADLATASASATPAEFQGKPPSGRPIWIAFELPPGLAWRADDGLAAVEVAGDSESRHRVISRLAREAAARAVVACNASSSPDRGTGRFLRDVSSRVGAVALLLVAPVDGGPSRAALWTTWLQDSGLGPIPVFAHAEAARDWLASFAGAT